MLLNKCYDEGFEHSCVYIKGTPKWEFDHVEEVTINVSNIVHKVGGNYQRVVAQLNRGKGLVDSLRYTGIKAYHYKGTIVKNPDTFWCPEESEVCLESFKRKIKSGHSVAYSLKNQAKTGKEFTYKGVTKTISQWSKVTGIKHLTLAKRLLYANPPWNVGLALTCTVRNNRTNNEVVHDD